MMSMIFLTMGTNQLSFFFSFLRMHLFFLITKTHMSQACMLSHVSVPQSVHHGSVGHASGY